MRAGAEVGFLRDGRPLLEDDPAQGVGVGAIPETGAMMQHEVPRLGDACMLVDKGRAVDFRAKASQHQ